MPKSKTNKDRKEQQLKFKTKIKKQMSEKKLEQELQQIPEIRQFPVWSSSEKLEVVGIEWEAIYNLLNFFKQAIVAGEAVMNRGIQSGKIKMKYTDVDGKEVTPEQVQEYSKKFQELYAKKIASEKAPDLSATENKILTETGEPYSNESENLPTEENSTNGLRVV